MKKIQLLALLILTSLSALAQVAKSPNGKIVARWDKNKLVVCYDGKKMTEISNFGLQTSNEDLTNLTFVNIFDGKKFDVDYDMIEGKKSHISKKGHGYSMLFHNAEGKKVEVALQMFNDGIAFRYETRFARPTVVKDEQTRYLIADGTRRWIQKYTDAYEQFFPLATDGNDVNTHWGYPALVEPQQGSFALFTEANIESVHSASSLDNAGQRDQYRVTLGRSDKQVSGLWHSPWRVVMMGTLKDIVASTLVTDVSKPCEILNTKWIKPGVVSWIYWAYNHGSNDYNIIKKYVDMAVTLHLPYVLIDAEWDEMKDGYTIEDALKYSLSKGIKPIIWYNSTTGWIDGAPGPKYRLNDPEKREKEFAWCEKMGVSGVKIDFFDGDTQATMEYCIDLLKSAAKHHLLVNFHGATIPRGWQRTYPNLVSTEGVYGAEWYNNRGDLTSRAAAHNATLPFTRNVVGPMDYTPCTFSDSQHPHITTDAHELALTILFESSLQHLADRPESYLQSKRKVEQALFGYLPTTWDDTKLLAGYPGEYVVMARRKGQKWFIAGINGKDEKQTLKVDLKELNLPAEDYILVTDAGKGLDLKSEVINTRNLPTDVDCSARGGFLIIPKGM